MAVIIPDQDLLLPLSHPGAGVAQLVEQRFRKPQVARSIRVAGSKSHFLPTFHRRFVIDIGGQASPRILVSN